jgi:hypothetical protein
MLIFKQTTPRALISFDKIQHLHVSFLQLMPRDLNLNLLVCID